MLEILGFKSKQVQNQSKVQKLEKELFLLQDALKHKADNNFLYFIASTFCFGVVSGFFFVPISALLPAGLVFSASLLMGARIIYPSISVLPTVLLMKWFSHQKRKDTLGKIDDLQKNIVEAKIENISNPTQTEADFVFNARLNLESSEQIQIFPVSLSEKLVNLLITAFNRPSRDKRKTIPLIDITDAEMSDRQLKNLLAAGMGKYNTRHLRLKNNELTDLAVNYLKESIVDKNSSFKKLKILDLSNNDLTSDCFPDLVAIIQHLNIEELNLSNNEKLCAGNSFEIRSFFEKLIKEMPSIKKLHLKNIGLSPECLAGLGKVLDGVTLLEYLDIRKNNDIDVCHVIENIKKKLKRNVSLKEIKTDYDLMTPRYTEISRAANQPFIQPLAQQYDTDLKLRVQSCK